MRIMSVFTSFGGLEKPGGFAPTIMMSTNPKVDDPWDTARYSAGHGTPQATAQGMGHHRLRRRAWDTTCYSAGYGTPQATAQGMGHCRLRRRAWDTAGYGAGHGTPQATA